MNDALISKGMVSKLNEPWSGLEGFMYSADMHAKKIGAESLMIEIRQDLILDEKWRSELVDVLAESLDQFQ